MQVVVLGTGAADGLPNAFCDCATCQWARASGSVRGQTCALVDQTLLLELGRGVGEAASRAGCRLSGVRSVLITHGDFDHADGAPLLQRLWAGAGGDLEVLATPPVLAALRHWLPPDTPISWRAAQAGATYRLASGHVATALPASHVDALGAAGLLWDVSGPNGRLLLATDTGPLPPAALAQVSGRAFDLVLLEQTYGLGAPSGADPHRHHDLAAFAATLGELRAAGAVNGSTDVVAVHLGHHNPPEPLLQTALAELGARAVADGTRIDLGVQRPGPRTLVLGGARSGKSTYAESLLAGHAVVDYVATGGRRPGDAEWQQRVAVHRARRPAAWRTHETADPVGLLARPGPPVLIDCLALWLTAAMDGSGAWLAAGWSDAGRSALAERVDALLEAWRSSPRTLVAVTNEVGAGVVPATASGRLFRDELGRLNLRMAQASDEVVLVVAGRPLRLRAGGEL